MEKLGKIQGYLNFLETNTRTKQMADPRFLVGGDADLGRGRGRQLPARLCFEKFVCQNARIGTLRGRAPAEPPLNPPMKAHRDEHIT